MDVEKTRIFRDGQVLLLGEGPEGSPNTGWRYTDMWEAECRQL